MLLEELKRRNVIRVATAYVVTAWVIVQVTETIFPFIGFSDTAIRNVIIVVTIGFVPTVILAWVFQFTPEGLMRDTGDQQVDPAARQRLDRLIIIVLVLGIAYFAFDKFVLEPQRSAVREAEVAEQAKAEVITGYYGDRSIAVLPFVNMSADPEQQYFVDGIAEEVLNLLASIRQLRVISRSSSFALRGQNLELPEIARRLGVAHVLEGSVRRVGNTVRVTAQLIDARTGTHLWSRTYEREYENVFTIQDEIAADVADNLKIKLLRPLPASRMIDPEAVMLTQQARLIYEQGGRDGIGQKMSRLLDRALEIDPNYVAAWKWRGYADVLLAGEGLLTEEEELRRYEEQKRRILELEPESAIVDYMNAYDAMVAGDYEDAAELFERSLSKDPNDSDAAHWAGAFARIMGKFDVAVRVGEHSVAIDPLCFTCLWQLSRSYLFAGDYDAAVTMRRRYMALGEGGKFHSDGGDDAQVAAGLAMAYHDLGDHEQAAAQLDTLMGTERENTERLVAEVAAWTGRKDLAFEWLEKAAAKDPPAFLRLMSPTYRNLRDDPRWEAFMASVGMSAARLAAIEFDPELPE